MPTDSPQISLDRPEPEVRSDASRRRLDRVRNSTCYKLTRGAADYFDDLISIGPVHIGLDPILGLVVPGLGDFLTQATTVPAMYCALFELRSVPLFLACVYNSLRDWLVGLVPVLGDILDCAVRSNRKNFRLLTGYVDDDPAIKSEVEGKAWVTAALIVVLGLAIWGLLCLIGWVGGAAADAVSSLMGQGGE